MTAYKLRVAKDLVEFQPPLQPKALVTREYLLPPLSLPKQEAPAAAPADPADKPAPTWLTGSANPSNSAFSFYQERRHRWILRNTEEEQKRALKLVEQAWREYYSAEEAKTKTPGPH